MKNLFVSAMMLTIVGAGYSAFGQTLYVPKTGNTSVSACTGVLYDHAGPNTSYDPNADGTLTINPAVTGNFVRLTFSVFAVEPCCDRLIIYNGTTTTAPLIGTYTTNPGVVFGTSTSGALTLRFISDGTTQYEGFAALGEC